MLRPSPERFGSTPPRHRVVALVLVAVVALASCGQTCDRDCAPLSQTISFDAELVDRNDEQLVFEVADGTRQEVLVTGRTWALKTGTVYHVAAQRDLAGVLTSSLPGTCDCGGMITHLDGSPIDTSAWNLFEERLRQAALYGAIGFAVFTLAWMSVRGFRRSRGWL